MMKKLEQVWLDEFSSGVFSTMASLNLVPHFIDDNHLTAVDVDLLYHFNHSGDKFISPITDRILANDESLTTEKKQTLAKLIYGKYATKWDKIYDALMTPYKPLENYHMVESSTESITGTEDSQSLQAQQASIKDKAVGSRTQNQDDTDIQSRESTQTVSYDNNEQTTYNSTQTQQSVQESDSNNNIYAFNSEVAAPQNENSSASTRTDANTHTGNDTVSHTGQDTTSVTDNISNTKKSTSDTQDFSQRDNESESTLTGKNTKENTETRVNSHTRSGNIGVTTSQQMLESELELRKYDLLSTVFEDVDTILCLSIY